MTIFNVLHKCNKRSNCQRKYHRPVVASIFKCADVTHIQDAAERGHTLHFSLLADSLFICISCCRFVCKYLLKMISNYIVCIVLTAAKAVQFPVLCKLPGCVHSMETILEVTNGHY